MKTPAGKVLAVREMKGMTRIYPTTRIRDLADWVLVGGLRIVMEPKKVAPKPFAEYTDDGFNFSDDTYDQFEWDHFKKCSCRKSKAAREVAKRSSIKLQRAERKAAREEAAS